MYYDVYIKPLLMTSSKNSPSIILSEINNHPDRHEIVRRAKEITDTVFDKRSPLISGEDIAQSIEDELPTALLSDFRESISNLLTTKLPESDTTLYSDIIAPLVNREISRSA